MDSESLSYFLLKTMGSEARDYHRPEHPLDVSKNLFPVGQLAALFHDIVYLQVDPTWEKTLAEILYPFVPSRTFVLDVRGELNHVTDPWLKVIVALFGFENETALIPMRGLNEFLSAVVFYKKMKHFLKPEELLRGLSCIEATIPFRKTDSDGRTPADRLKARIENIQNGPEGYFLSEPVDFDLIVTECKLLIENDLVSFGAETMDWFLSNSWNVMIENNPSLRNHFFSVSDYRKAIFGNIGFFSSLDAKNLYWTDSENLDLNHEKLIRRTENNLRMATEYMKAIAVSVSMVEAIAQQTGGECAYELFFGTTKKSREHSPVNMDTLIHFGPEPEMTEERLSIYKMLKHGRNTRSRFDHKTSSLSAFLYQKIPLEEFETVFGKVSQFHQGKVSADECLAVFHPQLVAHVIIFLEETALSRKGELMKMKTRFIGQAKKAG
ncbi:MAG: hypothetical protein H7235_07605 [Bdellovibrionaceae bacterium]|nr:hypothetical protein [Pseudobdellovibrionaceae bacterium]